MGYRVGSEVLPIDSAAERLATLVWRIRGALAVAAARLRSVGISGVYSVRACCTSDGRPLVVVTVKVTSKVEYARQDERAALVEAALNCRDAYLYAVVDGDEVHVCG